MALQHELPLVSTIAVGMSLAFVCGLVASKLRLSPIVGYLIAGIIIGPFSPGFTADIEIAEELAEIGIVLLMFGVGLHFSLKDLMDVRRIALPGAVVQITVATSMGALLALHWGWDLPGAILFGLALSVASTVVLIRALQENNLMESLNGRIAIGWLIVEDLVMILALVLVPALAGSGGHDLGLRAPWEQLVVAICKLGLFLVVMLVAGRRFLPWLLMVVTRTRSRELFTLAVFVVAVGLAYGAAALFGISFALGAFFAGMMIRESDMNHEVADRALPFQDAFAVLFFVSVGMLFNPIIIMEQPLNVLYVVGIIIVGKSVAAQLIVFLSGYPLKTGLMVSAGLAQIGEFSFILLGLALTYNLWPPGGADLVMAGALISIALNPLAFYLARKGHDYVSRSPRLGRHFNMHEDELAQLGAKESGLDNIVILVGHGRTGKHICQNMVDENINIVVIDSNRERVVDLRAAGVHAVVGDATHAETLEAAGLNRAIALVVAVSDPFEGRRIVEMARSLRPTLKVIVLAHNDEEATYYQAQDVDLTLTEPREVARRIVKYLLQMTDS